MNRSVAGFDWDSGNIAKCQRHGVTLNEIEEALLRRTVAAPDMKHSADEQRFITIVRNSEGRPMFIAFTFRERDGLTFIRPVSARYMHKEEVLRYEKSARDAH